MFVAIVVPHPDYGEIRLIWALFMPSQCAYGCVETRERMRKLSGRGGGDCAMMSIGHWLSDV